MTTEGKSSECTSRPSNYVDTATPAVEASLPAAQSPQETRPSSDGRPVSSRVTKNRRPRGRNGLAHTRSQLSRQFDALRQILPQHCQTNSHAKARVLENTISEIQSLMNRATFLAVELAVATPDSTQNWVRLISQNAHLPLFRTVATVMKLFAVRCDWRYAEWWTLDEEDSAHINLDNHRQSESPEDEQRTFLRMSSQVSEVIAKDGKPEGSVDDLGNIHGCVVRDSASVMRLAWTIVHRQNPPSRSPRQLDVSDDEGILEFARKSKQFKFGPRVGMPGRVWTSRRAEWLVDLRDRHVFPRSPLAEKFGMQTCLAVPIQFGGHVHSVMAFYSTQRRPYDPDSYDLACVLARSLSEVYAPSHNTPWNISHDPMFSPHPA